MSFKRGVLIGAALLTMGSLSWASAPDSRAALAPAPRPATVAAPAPATPAANKVLPKVLATIPQSPADLVTPAPTADLGGGLSLVAPPAELPRTNPEVADPAAAPAKATKAGKVTKAAKTARTAAQARTAKEMIAQAAKRQAAGLAPAAVKTALSAPRTAEARKALATPAPRLATPAKAATSAGDGLTIVPAPRERPAEKCSLALVAPGAAAPAAPAARTTATRPAAVAAPAKQVQAAAAPAAKPGKLFSYVRLLNYAPHPQTEEFLKDKPLALRGRNLWFSVRYIEGWKTLNDDEGLLQDVAFEISLMDGEQKIRTLKTPKVAIKADKMAKGQVLGIAEVAPYRFYITVDQVTLKKKGVAELVFKLDLIG